MPDETAPSYLLLDQSIQRQVDEMTRVFMEQMASAAEEVAHADPEDEGAPNTADLPSLTLEGLNEWLMRVCAPQPFVASSLHQYVDSVVTAKLINLRSIVCSLDAAVEEFLSGVSHILLTDDLIVNEPIAMAAVKKYGLPEGRIMLVPVPNLREPDPTFDEDGDETADIPYLDGLIAVVAWEGAYLCRTALVHMDDIDTRMTEAGERLPILPKPNVCYRQGKKPH